MIELEKVRYHLTELGLNQAAQSLDALLEVAGRSQSTYLSFLDELLEIEIQERQRRNVEVRMKLSHLPYRHTLEEFDFSFQPSIDERHIRELAGLTSRPAGSEPVFQLVSVRYERGSIILTSNKSFGEWGELLGDPVLATAVLSRLLYHCHGINIRGNSYRLKDKLKTGIYATLSAKVGQNYSNASGLNEFRR